MDLIHTLERIPELQLEIGFKWLCDPMQFRWIRQSWIDCKSTRGAPSRGPRVLGWSLFRPDGRRGGYRRRIFFVQHSDLNGVYDDQWPPGDAVDPRTIDIGVPGILPAKIGPLYLPRRRRLALPNPSRGGKVRVGRTA